MLRRWAAILGMLALLAGLVPAGVWERAETQRVAAQTQPGCCGEGCTCCLPEETPACPCRPAPGGPRAAEAGLAAAAFAQRAPMVKVTVRHVERERGAWPRIAGERYGDERAAGVWGAKVLGWPGVRVQARVCIWRT